MGKLVKTLKEAIRLCGLKDGMTVSFHHHLRNGDYVLNLVLGVIEGMGYKDIKIAPSSIFPIHKPLIPLIEKKVVTGITTNYMSGPVAQAISQGILEKPVVFHSHGGRPRAIEAGELAIDIAFIAAPAADSYGNLNGVDGPSACGSLGYAVPDTNHAQKVVALTDYLVDYPLTPISIDQTKVDYVVKIDTIGDPRGIVSGTTQLTRDPLAHTIAGNAARLIEYSGLLKEEFSFQTGAGGASLATAYYIKRMMEEKGIVGSFGLGGITEFFVDFLEQGLFKTLLDVQCFDLRAVQSLKSNPNHQEISASFYANPESKGCAVNKLDVVMLGATEIDTAFNVNVHTDSNGAIIGGSGGHSDAAAGAKLAIIVAPLMRARIPIVVDKVLSLSTPGQTIDALVTERGIAINPNNQDLLKKLQGTDLPLVTIEHLKDQAERLTGKPAKVNLGKRIVGEILYRDGKLIDTIRGL